MFGRGVIPNQKLNKFQTLFKTMVIKILGGLDLLTGIIFWIYGIFIILWNINIIPGIIIITLGVLLLIKGLIFSIGMDLMSFVDIIFGIIIISSANFKFPFVVVTFLSLFLIQKGIFSFLD